MQPLLEIAGVLLILLLVLRFSLRRRSAGFVLRRGLTGLNVITGSLCGAAAAVLLRGSPALRGPGGGVAPDLGPAATALRNILPLAGVALGGIAGYALLGAIWRRLLRDGSAATRDWLRRIEFALCAVAFVLLIRRLLG